MSFCVRLGPETDAAPLGGKARSLQRLAAAGLRVPAAFVVTSELLAFLRAGGPALPATLSGPDGLAAIERASRALALAPWPDELPGTLASMLRWLTPEPGARFAVRSSASIEDEAGALGAGLYLSRLDVPAGDVPQALRAVLLSALAPGVIAYFERRGLDAGARGFAVLIHPFVVGDAAGTAASEPASAQAPTIEAATGDAHAARGAIVAALSRLTARHGPSEVEWVANGAEVTFLQLRPYHTRRSARRAGQADGARGGWRWDAAHNPLPLSPAQAGLVALVDGACKTGFRQRVTNGYLFHNAAEPAEASDQGAAATATRATPARDALRALRTVADQRFAGPAPTLEDALDTFTAIYEPLFAVVQPAARAAREALVSFLRRHEIDPAPRLPALLAAIPSAASARRRRARAFVEAPTAEARAVARAGYLDEFGDESPCWDVVTPTWKEAPDALEQRLLGGRRDPGQPPRDADFQAASSAIRVLLPPGARDEWEACLAAARAATAASEDDDALYARAQAHLRRALLRQGARLAAAGVLDGPEAVFWLPLDAVRRDARGEAPLSRRDAAELLEAARRADADARANPPALWDAEADRPQAPDLVRGRAGAGGACVGRVRLWPGVGATRVSAPDDVDDVIVARTILPTELPLIAAAALVVETGGPLDHVSAQARERGIPAVVGAVGACARLQDGELVLVDGDAAVVVQLGER
jgi:phosphohistidine swiveling domain-containing protein